MIISGGWFEGKKAELRTNEAGDWVRLDDGTEFCIRDGKIYLSIDDAGREGEFRRIYDQLRKNT